ncbi:hypothetical protein D3C81_1885310 [compost metagenome]
MRDTGLRPHHENNIPALPRAPGIGRRELSAAYVVVVFIWRVDAVRIDGGARARHAAFSLRRHRQQYDLAAA